MSNDPSLLKYMGTQSHETMAMEAALAHRAVRSTEQAADQMLGKPSDKIDATSGDIGPEGTKLSDATNWATYTKEDPIRAILIAAGTGAVLMGLVAMMARSGARTVRRNVQG